MVNDVRDWHSSKAVNYSTRPPMSTLETPLVPWQEHFHRGILAVGVDITT